MKEVFKIFRVTPKGKLVVYNDGWFVGNTWIENEFKSIRKAEAQMANTEFSSRNYVILPVYIKF